MTSSFAVALAGQARAVATRALPRQFDAATIASSPAALLAIVERSGGLRGDQLAFCSGDGTPVAFALWWPWGGGDNISLRIGVVGVADAEQRLGQLFGVDG